MRLSNIPKSEFEIIGQDGQPKGLVQAVYSSSMIAVFDPMASIVVGDEMRRVITNGSEEAFEVVDPVFYEGGAGIPAHFQVKIRRKGTFPPGSGGNYSIQVSGNNARVNVHSIDKSTNIINDARIFNELRTAIAAEVPAGILQRNLIQAVEEMSASTSDRPSFLAAYQKFISSAADHMTVVAPFLPALAAFIG
ncbi:hypothetical protein [Shinella sp.]|uniref:hypothetical protein n=1 Tax=Shinella sp. TaxID=1870904 RepID=UPI0029BFFF19|nr:hypothetical protein [Shinella sp.]